jgi:hypothetical protein
MPAAASSAAGGATGSGADLSLWARAAAGLAYQGATGIFAAGPPDSAPPWLDVMRELSAAVPVASPSETAFAATAAGAPVCYKPFLRGEEGTVAVANSSADVLEVACEPRAEPLEANLVRFAPGLAPVRSHYMPFRFSQEAYDLGRPFIFLRMLPGETALLNLRVVDPSATWLRGVEERPKQKRVGPQTSPVPGQADWWDTARQRERERGQR